MLVARPIRRLALRRPTLALRFNSSTSSSSTAKTAQDTANKALSAASAQGAKALDAVRSVSSGVGTRVGIMLGAYREPLVYNFAVARELAKQVYVAENLRPPTSFESVFAAYRTAFENARNFSWWAEVLRSGYWAKLGVYALEAYGIFKIGEIIGRRKLVGYKLQQ